MSIFWLLFRPTSIKTRVFFARAFSARNSHSQLFSGLWEGRNNKASGSIFVRRNIFVMFLAFLSNGFARFLTLKRQKFHIIFARACGTRETHFHIFSGRRAQNPGIRELNLLMQRLGLFCLPSQFWCPCHKISYLKMSVSQFFFARDTFSQHFAESTRKKETFMSLKISSLAPSALAKPPFSPFRRDACKNKAFVSPSR